MSSKIIFSFLFGLFIGFAIGYLITDFYYRKAELKIGPMDEVHRQLEKFKEILKKNPNNFEALVAVGDFYYDSGQFEKAIPYYERAIKINKNPNVLTDLGTCLREIGNPEKAIKIYEEAFAIDPRHWKSIYNIIVVSIFDLKNKEKAIYYYEKLKELNPKEVNLESLYEEIQKIN